MKEIKCYVCGNTVDPSEIRPIKMSIYNGVEKYDVAVCKSCLRQEKMAILEEYRDVGEVR